MPSTAGPGIDISVTRVPFGDMTLTVPAVSSAVHVAGSNLPTYKVPSLPQAKPDGPTFPENW